MIFAFILFGIIGAVGAQTVTMEGQGRSLRARDLNGKTGSARQIIVEPDVDHVFPYALASNAWATTFYLTNLEDHPISVDCEYVGTNGEERQLAFDFNPDAPFAFTNSKIAAFATESFRTVSTATSLTTVWAYCSSEPRTDRFSGYAIVRNTAANGALREFVTQLQPEREPVFSVPFTDPPNNTTGLVLLNNALEEDSSIAIWFFGKDGKELGTSQLTLKPGNLRVIVLNDAFKDSPGGTVRVVVVGGTKLITGMALRTNAAGYSVLVPLTPKEAPSAN